MWRWKLDNYSHRTWGGGVGGLLGVSERGGRVCDGRLATRRHHWERGASSHDKSRGGGIRGKIGMLWCLTVECVAVAAGTAGGVSRLGVFTLKV